MTLGAKVVGGAVEFRVFAPKRKKVEVVFAGPSGEVDLPAAITLDRGDDGYFTGRAPGAGAGLRYRYRLDGGASFPDPASRFQPDGPHGPSEIVDSSTFEWRHDDFAGATLKGSVLYELHIGTFTEEGTYAAARGRLAHLAETGITTIEMMPLHEFPGNFGWGYDGVAMFAPSHLYGEPDDLRAFIDDAHRLGIAVILDVVYNHLGPDGNYLREFSDAYFTSRYETDWGEAVNLDGDACSACRTFFLENARYWIEEYRFDGLRIDATQAFYDSSPSHLLAEIASEVRNAAGKPTIVIGENEPQHARLLEPVDEDGYGLDGLWNDDFHHTAVVALTGRREAYYTDYGGSPQELFSALKWGFLYQGQRYRWQSAPRGTSALHIPAYSFVSFLENHDQVANSGHGERLSVIASPARLRALTALWLLGPATPMLFQGQEVGSRAPFFYFADHEPALATKVTAGRLEFLAQFPSLATPSAQALVPVPSDPDTFRRSKVDWAESETSRHALALHRDLLRLRRSEPAFRGQDRDRMHCAILTTHAFAVRFFDPGGDRLLLVNLGPQLELSVAPEPLLAPPRRGQWKTLWSSEDVLYGGSGIPGVDTEEGIVLPAESAVVLGAATREPS